MNINIDGVEKHYAPCTQEREVQKQIEILQKTVNMLKYKCWYYDAAVAAGTEDVVKNLPDDEIPEEVRDYKI